MITSVQYWRPFPRDLLQIQHNTPLQRLRMHLLENPRQILHLRSPEMRPHNPPLRHRKRLDRILAVPDRHAHNAQRLRDHHGRESGGDGLHLALGQADDDQRAAVPQQAHGRGVGCVGGCEHEHRLDAEAGRLGHDFFFGFALFVVDEVLCAAVEDDVFLAAGVDADDAHAHAARGDLDSDVAELWEEEVC
jgi:hypothetical protein